MKNFGSMLNGTTKKVLGYKQFGLVVATVIILIASVILTPSLFTFNAFTAMLASKSTYVILAVGVFFVLLTGGIDISIGSILAVSGVTTSKLMVLSPSTPAVVWLLVGILIGCICGFVNGFFASKFKIDPLIITLATMYIFRGVAYLISEGKWIVPSQFTEDFTALSQTNVLGMDSIIWWSILCIVIVGVVLGLTKFGRRIYAVGSSEESAKISGINVSRVKISAFVICGLCAGLCGVLHASYHANVSFNIGNGDEMVAIAICVLGGVSVTGGKGRIDGVVLGSFIMSVAIYLLGLLEGFSVWKDLFQGLIIVVALAINLTGKYVDEKRFLNSRSKKL